METERSESASLESTLRVAKTSLELALEALSSLDKREEPGDMIDKHAIVVNWMMRHFGRQPMFGTVLQLLQDLDRAKPAAPAQGPVSPDGQTVEQKLRSTIHYMHRQDFGEDTEHWLYHRDHDDCWICKIIKEDASSAPVPDADALRSIVDEAIDVVGRISLAFDTNDSRHQQCLALVRKWRALGHRGS